MHPEPTPADARATILILEDDPSLSLLERRRLERAGYSVRQAANAAEARQIMADGSRVDLLLLDYQLGNHSNGLAFYRELQSAGCDVPAILVTGFTDEAHLAEAIRAGVRDFIPKSAGTVELIAPAVERVMKQVRAERQLAESEARRRVDERFRTSVESMLDPFAIYTAVREGAGGGGARIIDFRIEYVNRAACERTRQSFFEQIGRSMLELYPAFGRTGLFDAFSRVVETGEPFRVESYPIDAPARLVQEGRVWLSFSVAKLGDGVTVAWRDVTARKEAELALERAKAEAEEASHAKDRFLAALSHELRTPLTPVLALASAMENDARFGAEVRENAATIRRNVDLEARLIDDILDVTRIIRGKLALKLREKDLRLVIEHVARMACEYQAAPRQITCVHELAPVPHIARVDPARMTQVFWNLLSNAVKFTPPGGSVRVRSRIEPAAQPSDAPHAIIEVSDTGIGIDPGAIGQIFKPFEQGEQGITRQFGGLGLGLTISKAIVERHGGTLSAHSEGRGRGATFTLRLPLLPAPVAAAAPMPGDASARAAAPGAAQPAPEFAAASGARLLLVEDHEDTGRIVARMLRRAGYHVTIAASVRAARDAAAAGVGGGGDGSDENGRAPFDLVISDIGLPDGTGHDLMRELRARHGLRGIALSGFGMEEDLRKSQAAGFERHLTKPVDFSTLTAAIREVLAVPS